MDHRSPSFVAPLLAILPLLAASPGAGQQPAVSDESYTAPSGERVIRQSVTVPAPLGEVWKLYTTSDGLASWAAPAAEVDPRVGGMIRSSFKVGGELGGAGTVTSRIVAVIPGHEITLVDDLVSLLTMGGAYDWLDLFPQAFLDELERDGDDVYTTVRFEPESEDTTRVTLFSYGHREGGEWDRVVAETRKSNAWFLGNLLRRVADGPIDWSAGG